LRGLVLKKEKLEALFKALRELFICYSLFYRTAIILNINWRKVLNITDKPKKIMIFIFYNG